MSVPIDEKMNQSLSNFWNDTMQIPEARWIVAGTLLIFAVLIAVYVSFFFRNLAFGDGDNEKTDILSDFRRMRDEGQIADSEFSKLKTVIPEHNQPEILRTEAVGKPGSKPENEKRFMTLQEAETEKQEKAKDDQTNEMDQAKETE